MFFKKRSVRTAAVILIWNNSEMTEWRVLHGQEHDRNWTKAIKLIALRMALVATMCRLPVASVSSHQRCSDVCTSPVVEQIVAM